MSALNSYTFDELFVGMEFSLIKDVTRELVNKFSKLSGDYHPLHCDVAFAKENELENIIAHGMLLSSFASALVGMQLPGKNMILLSQSFEYLKPVYVNSRVKVTGTIKRKVDPLKVVQVSIIIRSTLDDIVAKGDMNIKLLR